MARRLSPAYRPDLESLEAKHLLSGGVSPGQPALNRAYGFPPLPAPAVTDIKLDRITNPKDNNALLFPPFGQVLVQRDRPVPGQVYNVLFISVLNGSGRTFHASDNIEVRTRNQPPGFAVPILTGNQEWKPGERMVFYLLSKKYYPLSPVQSSGFVFNFVRPAATAIPGPSGLYLRLRYNPATFAKDLDRIVSAGIGARGHQLGLPDTAIWELFPPNARYVRL